VRKFVGEFHASGKKLHVIINNAGLALNFKDVKRQYTTDGFELTIGTNYLGRRHQRFAHRFIPVGRFSRTGMDL